MLSPVFVNRSTKSPIELGFRQYPFQLQQDGVRGETGTVGRDVAAVYHQSAHRLSAADGSHDRAFACAGVLAHVAVGFCFQLARAVFLAVDIERLSLIDVDTGVQGRSVAEDEMSFAFGGRIDGQTGAVACDDIVLK